jgi:hypothetical protein
MAYQPYNSVKQNLRGYQSPSGLPVRTKPLAQRCARAAILFAIRKFVSRTAAHLACLSLLVPDVSAEKAAGASSSPLPTPWTDYLRPRVSARPRSESRQDRNQELIRQAVRSRNCEFFLSIPYEVWIELRREIDSQVHGLAPARKK